MFANTTVAPLIVSVPATAENYNEQGYLAANPDVAKAVRNGALQSGRQHFDQFGKTEKRFLRRSAHIDQLRRIKLERLTNLIRDDLPYQRRGLKYDFLTKELRIQGGIDDTENISENGYGSEVLPLIEEFRDGIILDCGSGKRPVYYPHVINYEIVDYDTTDVLGIGENLPFKDNSFDAVFSIAVLEHVRDPFRCATEIVRVLKPKGKLFCGVPFLQPFHGYPHHYYNMTYMGLRNLFAEKIIVDRLEAAGPCLPIWSLSWIVKSWAEGLKGDVRREFLDMPLRELCRDPHELYGASWVKSLSKEKNFELASGTFLYGHK